jgi:cytidine deaminase
MYTAKSASLRSSDLSRQVGAAIFRVTGEVVTLGCNEVPKAGGGTYWPDDPGDARDFKKGFDPNEHQKLEILVNLLHSLKEGGHLAQSLTDLPNAEAVGRKLLEESAEVKDSKLMDIIEFGRIIHAEMSAICDAARRGVSIDGTTLYCTTFPCHLCAKHIVASGICRVVYLEPYPKSYAEKLHADSIEVETDTGARKVLFEPFIGVSPYRYRDLFEKGKRKYNGVAEAWPQGEKRPMIEVYFPSYFEGESRIAVELKRKLGQLDVPLPDATNSSSE